MVQEMRSPDLLAPVDAAAQLGVTVRRVYQLIASGQLDSVKVGGARRIPHSAIEAFVASLTRTSENEEGIR